MPRVLIPNSTQIPDIILDHWMAELSGAEFKVLLYVARRTYGFGKESDNISLAQLATGIRRKNGTPLDRGTGLSRSGVKVACNGLIEMGLLIRTGNTAPDGAEAEESTYRLNLFASSPTETEEEGVGQKEADLGQYLAYPGVGQNLAQVGQNKTSGRPKRSLEVGQKLALQETEQETEQETASAKKSVADAAELVESLVGNGVGRSVAVRLAAQKPDLCRRYLEWLPFADVKTTPGQWLSNAIRDEYGPPERAVKRQSEVQRGMADPGSLENAPQSRQDDRGAKLMGRLRQTYGRLAKTHPDAITAFHAFVVTERQKVARFAESLTEKGKREVLQTSDSEEFMLTLFERWLLRDGRRWSARKGITVAPTPGEEAMGLVTEV